MSRFVNDRAWRSMLCGAMALGGLAVSVPASAQVFEVIHPDVEEGGFELEFLGGRTLESVEDGEEQGAFEVGLFYGLTSFWKTGLALEIADPRNESLEYEATEWENVILLYGGHSGHDHAHDHTHGHDGGASLDAVALYAKLEIPQEGGLDEGAIVTGPALEFGLGGLHNVANLFVEFPFADDADPGLSYAFSSAMPLGMSDYSLGLEAHGAWEGAFGDDVPFSDNTHVVGPAVYASYDIGQGRALEPRLALLFGLTDESPDAVLSLNVELKF